MSINEWVPWVVAIGNCGSLALTMRGNISGFLVLIVAQLIFIVYAGATDQTGFLLQNVVMTGIAIHAIIRWRKQGVHYQAKENNGNEDQDKEGAAKGLREENVLSGRDIDMAS